VIRPALIGGAGEGCARRLAGREIGEVTRRAKNIVFTLRDNRAGDDRPEDGSSEEDRLVINLGMTGRVTVLEQGVEEPPYLGVRFVLSDGRVIAYQDVRRFGHLEALSGSEWRKREERLGVEPLSPELDGGLVHRLTRDRRVAVKPWLMDQKFIVGVGNIYASEALFRARISPLVAAGSLSKARSAALAQGVKEVLQEAIEFRGTTLLDYRDANGEKGEFSKRLRVYGREGEECVRCGERIVRMVQGGRSTFYCPGCHR
jgi:formamidopyrimidine-DNA glycosylase